MTEITGLPEQGGGSRSPLYSLEWDGGGTLGTPVLVHAMTGFIDAGAAGRTAVEHLLARLEHRRIATFDHDLLLDYRSRRPVMTFEGSHWATYDTPQLVLDAVWDATGTPFLLLHGSEPDLQWERFVGAVQQLSHRLRVSLTVRLHGVPMSVPHTRPLVVGAHGNDKDLIGPGLPWISSIQIPGSAAALLELRLGSSGARAIGLAAQVPQYLAQATYPQAAVGLLEALQRSSGLTLPIGELSEQAVETGIQIDRQVSQNEDAAALVAALERQYDAFVRGSGLPSLLADPDPIPTPDEIGEEFEKFLAHEAQREQWRAEGTTGNSDKPDKDIPSGDPEAD